MWTINYIGLPNSTFAAISGCNVSGVNTQENNQITLAKQLLKVLAINMVYPSGNNGVSISINGKYDINGYLLLVNVHSIPLQLS